jgi:4-amino-4-deoxy-L-arabinose transferase-like glycosyltransferase
VSSSSGPSEPTAAAGRVRWYVPAVVILLVLPIVAASQVEAHLRIDPMDDGYFAFCGWRIASGDVLYHDVWDNKPPGIFWLNALAFLVFGAGSYLGIVVTTTVGILAAVGAFWAITRRCYPAAGAALGTVLFALYFTHGAYHGGSNRIETYLAAAELLAVAAFVHGALSRRIGWIVAAGLAAGAAITLKQTGIAALGALLAYTGIALLLRWWSWRLALTRAGALLAGVALLVGATVSILAVRGNLPAAYEAVFAFNRVYFEAEVSEVGFNFTNYLKLRRFVFPVLTLPVLLAIAALVHAALRAPRELRKPATTQLPAPILLAAVWLAAACFSAWNAPHGYRYYLLPIIPPLLLLATDFLARLQGELGLLERLRRSAAITGALVLIGYFALGAAERQVGRIGSIWSVRQPTPLSDSSFQWEVEPQPWQRAAAHAREITAPSDRLHVWGYWPYVYLEARRPNVSRFFITDMLMKLDTFAAHAPPQAVGRIERLAAEIRTELRTTLQARPPKLILINRLNFPALVDPSRRVELTDPLDDWLAGWLAERYTRVPDAPDPFVIFERRPGVVGQGESDPADLSPGW